MINPKILELFRKTMKMSNEHWRYGQTLFNALYELDSEMANKIRATEHDPFYDDGKVDKFLDYLDEEWK